MGDVIFFLILAFEMITYVIMIYILYLYSDFHHISFILCCGTSM